ncbi:hypothetical protein FDUTEX481_02786 [Tolypothrix sp. PCC 7601]|nr:hypothetical protein FDUTEX481_02786 [Tolypothrix sp. PCC 7601]BAY92799.1 hypothetical protein NIES3275_48360 [Microchaete diplosiphon NIES-3275]
MRQIVGAWAMPCPLEYIDVSQTLFDLVLINVNSFKILTND